MRIVLVIVISCLILISVLYMRRTRAEPSLYARMHSLESLCTVMPTTPEALQQLIQKSIYGAHIEIAQIIAVPDAQRTYKNTMAAFDHLISLSDLALAGNIAAVLEHLSPHDTLREAAHEAVIEINTFFIEHVNHNEALFNALKAYADGNGAHEQLRDDQRYFITETMKDFERAGLLLPPDKRAELVRIDTELTRLCAEFAKNIAQEKRTIAVSRDQLAGLSNSFIDALKKNDAGLYLLGVDYPTYFQVLEHCAVEETRKTLSQLFSNRAYPANREILNAIRTQRHARAQLVGFDSYAAFDIANQMAETTETAEKFLINILMRTIEKEEQELISIIGPDALKNPIKAWNLPFNKETYKKTHLALDENIIRTYFPTEKTIDGLIRIYEQFFGLRFVKIPATGLWCDELYALNVYTQKDTTLLGTFILDLYPRPNKFSHAAHSSLVPAFENNPEISIVFANFSRATAEAPSLLSRNEVKTFFHEFGHAIHALLGRTQIASCSGTHVKRDFVEMPSQMLEEWLWDPEILRMISSHYQTGEPLPQEMITQIIKLKQFDAALTTRTQARYALMSLAIFTDPQVDIDALVKSIYTTYAPHIAWDPDNHLYASFGHLTGYGAKYYGYLWSKVFALDLFNEIQKTGLLNTAAGRRYSEAVLVPGGSKPPHLLLHAFLGREPRIDAFIKDLGL